jgi:regulation of enolase protein 1 (concanavalin A-like superfamily)
MESLNWYNSSQGANIKSPAKNSISFKTNPKTDIWRTPREHRKNAHFFYQDVSGDFLVSVKFKGDYKSQYDQAGIMLRVGDEKWLKSGIEMINGVPHVR